METTYSVKLRTLGSIPVYSNAMDIYYPITQRTQRLKGKFSQIIYAIDENDKIYKLFETPENYRVMDMGLNDIIHRYHNYLTIMCQKDWIGIYTILGEGGNIRTQFKHDPDTFLGDIKLLSEDVFIYKKQLYTIAEMKKIGTEFEFEARYLISSEKITYNQVLIVAVEHAVNRLHVLILNLTDGTAEKERYFEKYVYNFVHLSSTNKHLLFRKNNEEQKKITWETYDLNLELINVVDTQIPPSISGNVFKMEMHYNEKFNCMHLFDDFKNDSYIIDIAGGEIKPLEIGYRDSWAFENCNGDFLLFELSGKKKKIIDITTRESYNFTFKEPIAYSIILYGNIYIVTLEAAKVNYEEDKLLEEGKITVYKIEKTQ